MARDHARCAMLLR